MVEMVAEPGAAASYKKEQGSAEYCGTLRAEQKLIKGKNQRQRCAQTEIERDTDILLYV